MRALITGAGGFVGSHLRAYLLTHTKWQLLGTVYPAPPDNTTPHPNLNLVQLDLKDQKGVSDLIQDWQPDVIFHLAARSSVAFSFQEPWDTLNNNIQAQLNILEAARSMERPPRVLVIGSNEEYGKPQRDELPVTESNPLRPMNPYAVSKISQDFLGLQYYLSYGVPVVRLRPFNHTGPGQSPNFVVPAFASQIARIEAGLQEPVMRVGNLDVARDFTDVRDIVCAYYIAATSGQPGEVYNLASGHPQSIRELLETLRSLSTVEIQVRVDPERYRPSDTPVIYGSAEKFHQQTGWEPEIPFEQTLQDVLTYWRAQNDG